MPTPLWENYSSLTVIIKNNFSIIWLLPKISSIKFILPGIFVSQNKKSKERIAGMYNYLKCDTIQTGILSSVIQGPWGVDCSILI